MAQIYNVGETKVRPGVYYRYTSDVSRRVGAMNGVNAIVLNAPWGPTGEVTSHTSAKSLVETYGSTDGVECAKLLFEAGAETVYVYRPSGTGGKAGSGKIGSVATITAKYPGARELKIKIQGKLGDATMKQALILEGSSQLESFEFAVSEDETTAFKEALAKSKYVTVETTGTGLISLCETSLTGGANASLTAEDYLNGFYALEPYRYNVLSTDSVDASVIAVQQAYVAATEKTGKFIITVVGAPVSTSLDERMASAKATNDKKIVYFGSAYVTADGTVIDGAKAINYTAGLIAATPANQSIVHTAVAGAVDTPEKLTNAQYEDAIRNGLLLLSVGPDGQVWYDSGINTLVIPAGTEDDGWKKIKRTKIRFELFDRIDRAVAPLVGKINCDPDGIAAVLQQGQGVITDMVSEGKLRSGGSIIEDPDNPHSGDSAWFLIQVDDIDSLEKIYLHYQFRYSANA